MEIIHPGKDLRIAELRVGKTESYDEKLCVINLRDVTEQVSLREELRLMSFTDDLTGLYNRRAFMLLAQQQIKLSNRTKKRAVLYFADLDNLKRINDTLGHKQGDLALIETANIIRVTFRKSEIIARMGGDEFSILAVEVSEGSAEILTTRLQKNLKAHNAKGKYPYNLELSMGMASYDPECSCSIDELLKEADNLMYAQKLSKRRSK